MYIKELKCSLSIALQSVIALNRTIQLQYTSIQSSLDVSSKELNLLGVNVGGGLATSLCDSGGGFGFSVVSF